MREPRGVGGCDGDCCKPRVIRRQLRTAHDWWLDRQEWDDRFDRLGEYLRELQQEDQNEQH